MKRVLVTGSNGQLGTMFKSYKQDDSIQFIFTDSSCFDITNSRQMDEFLSENEIDYLINCAAYTNVDLAEKEESEARLVNSLAPAHLAILSKKYDFTLIQISTDYVFGGDLISFRPYVEGDVPSPINVYGESKLMGETNIKNITDRHYIIRTSGLYSIYGDNFFNMVYNNLLKGKNLKITTQQTITPTSTHLVCKAILHIILNDSKEYGTYHIADGGITNWYNFAKSIADNIGPHNGSVEPVGHYETYAKRPKFSVLNTNKFSRVFNLDIPSWEYSLKHMIDMLDVSVEDEEDEEVELTKWETRFVEYAEYVANWSKDKKTKVGCVIVDDSNNILSTGYNGFPRGADDNTDQRRYEPPRKHMWTEHAERNTIYNAGRNGVSLLGSNLYCTYFPCVDCARGIIQSGIKKVYSPKPDLNHHKWGDSWVESIIMLKECGVEIIWT